ncbi:MAG: winged helix-turn-helix transcriptional regulator [Saprospiraceae bacterium]
MKKATVKELNRNFCPVTKAMRALGDKWTLLIMRECFWGFKRFDDFQNNLNISKSVLTKKLNQLIEQELLEKQSYKESGQRTRYEYTFTQKGKDLTKIILSFLDWGNKYLVNEGETTIKVVDKTTKNDVNIDILDSSGKRLKYRELEMRISKK